MKSFIVSFHQEDHVDSMQVQKLDYTEFEKAVSGGIRQLFDLDTNIGYFAFLDAEDEDGDLSYMVVQYEETNEDPSGYYSFAKDDFYEFMALYLQGINEEEDSEEYGPIHHLAHLLHHILEEGGTETT
ncbi:cytosolic protein [Bacillus massiliglaciei]|uniref:cytosolic protein n=1 Tax=Bacillus massiliglaciei TaxID=1816693 RepID=UPI000DA61CED|nr:cytosolic protein [Bacillus massiliglaciei]